MCQNRAACGLILMAVCLALSGGSRGDEPEELKAGICNTLFTDIPEGKANGSIKQFEDYLKAQTRQKGEFVKVKEPEELARKLANGDLHLGVFHGYEFAWASKNDPKLKILVLAVNEKVGVHAEIYVGKDSKIASFADLKGKSIAIPEGTRSFCKLFLARACEKEGKKQDEYFSKLTKPPSVEDGLDDVVDGLVDAVVVDEVAAANFKQRKEVRFGKLKRLMQSPTFPAGVVAYHEGSITASGKQKIYKALKEARNNPDGKQILLNWRMTGFEDPPKEYEQLLKDTYERYPPEKK